MAGDPCSRVLDFGVRSLLTHKGLPCCSAGAAHQDVNVRKVCRQAPRKGLHLLQVADVQGFAVHPGLHVPQRRSGLGCIQPPRHPAAGCACPAFFSVIRRCMPWHAAASWGHLCQLPWPWRAADCCPGMAARAACTGRPWTPMQQQEWLLGAEPGWPHAMQCAVPGPDLVLRLQLLLHLPQALGPAGCQDQLAAGLCKPVRRGLADAAAGTCSAVFQSQTWTLLLGGQPLQCMPALLHCSPVISTVWPVRSWTPYELVDAILSRSPSADPDLSAHLHSAAASLIPLSGRRTARWQLAQPSSRHFAALQTQP